MKPLVFKKRRRVRVKDPVRQKLAITKGDRVRVISGDFAGKEGVILRVNPKNGRVVIDGLNLVKKHKRATQGTEGGIIQFPAPMHHSKVMLLDPKSGEPTRIKRQRDKDGTVERLSVK
ncbi:MAG TPA: 50S ribosomal protein L24, partial [Gemmatimonadales bacterium]